MKIVFQKNWYCWSKELSKWANASYVPYLTPSEFAKTFKSRHRKQKKIYYTNAKKIKCNIRSLGRHDQEEWRQNLNIIANAIGSNNKLEDIKVITIDKLNLYKKTTPVLQITIEFRNHLQIECVFTLSSTLNLYNCIASHSQGNYFDDATDETPDMKTAKMFMNENSSSEEEDSSYLDSVCSTNNGDEEKDDRTKLLTTSTSIDYLVLENEHDVNQPPHLQNHTLNTVNDGLRKLSIFNTPQNGRSDKQPLNNSSVTQSEVSEEEEEEKENYIFTAFTNPQFWVSCLLSDPSETKLQPELNSDSLNTEIPRLRNARPLG